MPSRKSTTNVVLVAMAGLALAGTVASASGNRAAPPNGSPSVSSTVVAGTVDASGSRVAEENAAEAAQRAADAKAATSKAADAKAAADRRKAADAKAAAARAAARTWAVTKVVDGDTIWVSRDGISRKVRYIGIDTPEIGECGYAEATSNLRRILGGQRVTLTAGARSDVDRYGRLLRYVDVDGVDSGLRQIKQGYAVARYDSRDGYGSHTRESAYVRADAASASADCASTTTTPRTGTGSSTPSPVKPAIGSWPLAGDRFPCSRTAPIKGNESSMIAHSPGQQSYLITNPERCFTSLSQAAAAGYRPAKR